MRKSVVHVSLTPTWQFVWTEYDNAVRLSDRAGYSAEPMTPLQVLEAVLRLVQMRERILLDTAEEGDHANQTGPAE